MLGREPCIFQVYPYVAFIEETTTYIRLSTAASGSYRTASNSRTETVPGPEEAEPHYSNPYAKAALQLHEISRHG